MDNAQKAIMIGVGLFITIIVIAAVMLITGIGQDLLNSGTQKASSISDNLQASLTSQYDNTTMTGSQVISAVKSNYKTAGLIVRVGGKNYGTIVADGTPSLSANKSYYTVTGTKTNDNVYSVGPLSDSSSDEYVNPAVKYTARLIKIEGSEAIVGIAFDKKD